MKRILLALATLRPSHRTAGRSRRAHRALDLALRRPGLFRPKAAACLSSMSRSISPPVPCSTRGNRGDRGPHAHPARSGGRKSGRECHCRPPRRRGRHPLRWRRHRPRLGGSAHPGRPRTSATPYWTSCVPCFLAPLRRAIFEREKARAVAGLKDALTRPDAIAGRAVSGRPSIPAPYGRQSTRESRRSLEPGRIARLLP